MHETIGLGRRLHRGRDSPAGQGIDAVALTGGVFQNARLTEVVEQEILASGLRVLAHQAIPPNDGGISIGQAAIAGFTR